MPGCMVHLGDRPINITLRVGHAPTFCLLLLPKLLFTDPAITDLPASTGCPGSLAEAEAGLEHSNQQVLLLLLLHSSTTPPRDSITREEVERCKDRDLLENMLAEMAGEFPALSRYPETAKSASNV